MPYNIDLADRVRFYLADIPELKVEEKAMFRGLAFMVNGKMCVNISGDNLMCRVDPLLYEDLSKRKGYLPMIMKGKQLNGYCYVAPAGYKSKSDFDFWMRRCIEFNEHAQASASKKRSSKR